MPSWLALRRDPGSVTPRPASGQRSRVGERWTPDEANELAAAYRGGAIVEQLAAMHLRTENSIRWKLSALP